MLALGAALAAAGGGMALGYTYWNLASAATITVVALYVHGHMGISHVIAGLIATPGCEMKAPQHLLATLRGTASAFVSCPGAWKPLDRWEVRFWQNLRRSTTA